VDRSLLSIAAGEPRRYVLTETARLFARERLAADGQLPGAQLHMAEAVLAALDAAYEHYWSLDEAEWLHRYEPEIDNARAALDWATREQQGLGAALLGSAWPLLVESDRFAEGRGRYEQALALLCEPLPQERVGRFWEAIAVYHLTRQCDRARYAAEIAAEKARLAHDVRARYFALILLASASRDEPESALATLRQAMRWKIASGPRLLSARGDTRAGHQRAPGARRDGESGGAGHRLR
jgi:hypothetical protein